MSWPLIVSAPILRIGCGVKAGRKPGSVYTARLRSCDNRSQRIRGLHQAVDLYCPRWCGRCCTSR